jgi:hypothetical protein
MIRRGLLGIEMILNILAVTSLVLAASATCSTVAKASDVDWKLYGSSTVDGDTDYCFYDLRGAVETPDRHVRVWAKCLHGKAMDAIDKEKDFGGAILKNTARKIIDKYIPPIALVEDLSVEDAMHFSMFEETANVSGIKPAIRVFYELDCSKKMLRELSIEVFKVDGRIRSKRQRERMEVCSARDKRRAASNTLVW